MADLWSVVVGGLIGLTGGLVGPPLLHRLQREEERRKSRLAKFEELVALVYEHDAWVDLLMVNEIEIGGPEERLPPSPLTKARAIAVVHFPTLSPMLKHLHIVEQPIRVWGAQRRLERVRGQEMDLSGQAAAHGPFYTQFLDTIEKLAEFGEREFKRAEPPFALWARASGAWRSTISRVSFLRRAGAGGAERPPQQR